jgi:hypothetical protein
MWTPHENGIAGPFSPEGFSPSGEENPLHVEGDQKQ